MRIWIPDLGHFAGLERAERTSIKFRIRIITTFAHIMKTLSWSEPTFSLNLINHHTLLVWISVRDADPQWFNADPNLVLDPGFWWLEIEKEIKAAKKFVFFWSKITIYLSLGLYKGRPSHRRSPQKRTSSNAKHEVLNADPDPAT